MPHQSSGAGRERPAARHILAPLPLPLGPSGSGPGPDAGQAGPLFYLSWAGWELYLRRRLSPETEPGRARPLLLPDLRGPEEDFAALDQLVRAAGELGPGLLESAGRAPESLPGLISALRRREGPEPEPSARPEPQGGARSLMSLDDRSYLALWAVSEYQARRSDRLLAEAAARERSMWAALKGEEEGGAEIPPPPPSGADRRTLYAWRCWRRLAGPLLLADDVVVPNAPSAEDD